MEKYQFCLINRYPNLYNIIRADPLKPRRSRSYSAPDNTPCCRDDAFFFHLAVSRRCVPSPGVAADGRAILHGILYVRFGRFHENERHERRKAPGTVGADRRKALPRSSVRRVSHGRVNRRAPGNARDGATTGRKDDAEARTNKGRDPAGNPARTDVLPNAPRLRVAETKSALMKPSPSRSLFFSTLPPVVDS